MGIYTCTMNLAIDLFIETEHLYESKVNRALSDDIQANGKGVNVSFIMKRLGLENTALGFSGGFTGKYVADNLEAEGIAAPFVEVEGLTRINVFTKVNATCQEFKLVNQGPLVNEAAQCRLLQQISKFKKGDYLVVSGSLPRGVPSQILYDIAKLCYEKGVNLIFDVSDCIIMDSLSFHPFLLKPNEEELATWFGKNQLEEEQLISYAKQLIVKGARHVLLSLGQDGAIFIDSHFNVYQANAPRGKVVNTACAGDTVLGTFWAGFIRQESLERVLAKSVAAGSSTAFRSGITDFSDVNELKEQIMVKKIKE